MHRTFIVIAICLAACLSHAHADTFVSTDVPKAIPDYPQAGVESQLVVPMNRVMRDVNVVVTISHTFDGDLGLYLLVPNGDVIRLAFRCGNSGHGYTNTVFDDSAAVFICNGNPPFTGHFQPDQSLISLVGRGSAGLWKLRVTDFNARDTGSILGWRMDITLGDTLAVSPLISHPTAFILSAFPNPFNPTTQIAFSLPGTARIQLAVYNPTGRCVATLADEVLAAGEHEVMFDGSVLPSGVYFARLQSAEAVKTTKLLLLK